MNKLLISFLILFMLHAHMTPSAQAASDLERDALVALYNATDGDNWLHNSNWLEGDPCTNNWPGVLCNDNGEVYYLNLENENLRGNIPSEIGNLTNLENFKLSYNMLSGSVPSEIINLTNLKELTLSKNKFCDPVDPDIIAFVDNFDVGWVEWQECQSTTESERNSLVTFYNATNGNNWLRNSNWLNGDPCLDNWYGIVCKNDGHIAELNLRSNNLNGSIPSAIADLKGLVTLLLGDNNLSGSIPPEIGNLVNLKGIYLFNNSFTGNIPHEIGNLTQLENFSIGWNGRVGVTTLTNLSGGIPPEIGNLVNLKHLVIQSTSIGGSIPPEIGKLTNLAVLNLESNDLSGGIPPEIGNLVNLKRLILNANDLGGGIPPEIGNLTNLTELSFVRNSLTGSIPPEFQNLTNLTSLMLWYNQLCDPSDSDVITFVTALDSRWQETQECDAVTDTDANDDYVLDESNLYTAMTAEAEAATSDISPPPPRLNLLDLVFVIDTTNSMYDDIDAVKARALEILDLIDYGSVDWRVGLVTYRDYPYSPYGDRGDYTSRIDLNFTSNRSDIVAEINRINVGGGGDFPESVYSGLMTAIRFPWRTDAKKVIILMGDAPPHDPEPETGFTRNQVLQAAFDADRKNVYPILISDSSDTRDAFQILADGSSGRMFRAEDASVVVDTLMRTIISITDDRELSSMLASGESATVYTDDGSNLNLRSGPGVGNEIVSKLPSGTNVIILGGPVFGAPYIWWNIQTPSGISGWAVEAAGGGITLIPMLTWDLNLSGGEPIMGYGDVLSGRKSSDATDILVFTGNRGDIVMIDALSDEFYTYLRLFDTNNILLAEDNNRMDTNSSIRYELLADGKYYIVIDGYESSAAGDYNVSLEIEPPIDPMSVPSCPGAPMTRFRAGDIAVVDFNDPEALRIIDDPLASMFTTLAQLYDNNRVELLEGPICSAGKYYWRVYYNRLDVFGWIAEGDSRPYLCRISDPECR